MFQIDLLNGRGIGLFFRSCLAQLVHDEKNVSVGHNVSGITEMKAYFGELKAYLRPPRTIPVAILLIEILKELELTESIIK
jgi:hypothetical protein